MNLKIYNTEGTESRDQDYGVPEFEGDKGLKALRQVVLAYQANRRQGNACTKGVGQVAGTGKKPFRQKGTGNARQGNKRSALQRGGGIPHGPLPRDYTQKINRKVRTLAFGRALFDRAAAGELAVIERWNADDRKTKTINTVLTRIAPKGRVLIVDDGWADSAVLATRNIERLTITEAATLNALDLCDYHHIIVSEKGIEKIISRTV